jgi:hypothetical protein
VGAVIKRETHKKLSSGKRIINKTKSEKKS